MDPQVLLQGIIIGFSIAAPVGPIGILCIRQTLSKGRVYGIISGLGAATADAVYGAIAAFGITIISNVLIAQRFWLAVLGGAFLFYLGIRVFLAKPNTKSQSDAPKNLLGDYATTFGLTITNPMTIISFAAVYVGVGFGTISSNLGFAALFVVGIFLGSTCWWLILSSAVGMLRTRITVEGLRFVNRISGLVIIGFGIFILISQILF
jgi:threonine/homoserine/homoserine lactone efflux protein